MIDITQPLPRRAAVRLDRADRADRGARGNERLTAWVGAALVAGFGAQGLTLLDLHAFLPEHLVIGCALLLPVALKIAVTGYRVVRYYTHAPAYRRLGPPRPLLRVLAPLLVLNTLAVLGTGVGLLVSEHAYRLGRLHTLSFVTWICLATVHVLAYVWRVPRLLLADVLARGTSRAAALLRAGVAVGAGLLGLGLGAALLPWLRQWVLG